MKTMLYLFCLMPGLMKTSRRSQLTSSASAIEGAAYTITGCTLKAVTNYTELRWTAVINNTSTVISKCYQNGSCTDSYQGFVARLAVPGNRSNMTIQNVSRIQNGKRFNVETQWSCQWFSSYNNNTLKISQSVAVYAKPKSIECDFQYFKGSNGQINCTVDKVYPSASCELLINKTVSVSTKKSTGVTKVSSTPIYYKTTCIFTTDSRFFIGYNHLQVKAYPNCFGCSRQSVYSETANITLVIDGNNAATREGAAETYSIIAIVLGVTTAILACAVIALGVVTLFWWRRSKRPGSSKCRSRQGFESYDRPENPQQDERMPAYTEFGNNLTDLYENTQPRGQSTRSDNYLNVTYKGGEATASPDEDNGIYEN